MKLEHITKSYAAPVIRDLSYDFRPGKLYVIKGVSGCGKSTLLNILAGLETNYSGRLERIERPGYIFQNSLLLAKLTVRENLQMISDDPAVIEALAGQLGIAPLLDKCPDQLSGGERQRAAIARALLRDPRLLLADEPTASLDSGNSAAIAALLASLRREDRILIVATHESCFDAYADEILHLRYGVIDRVEHPRAQAVAAMQLPGARGRRQWSALRYAWRRNPGLLRPGKLLPLVGAFLLVLLVSTLQMNFSGEYLRYLQSRHPMDLILMSPGQLNAFEEKDRLTVYEPYTATDGELTARYLPSENASVFRIPGMLQAGRFPEDDREILVTADFGPDSVGTAITFLGESYTITGVVGDLRDQERFANMRVDPYYADLSGVRDLFIPYEALKKIAKPMDTNSLVCVYPGLAEDGQFLEQVRNALQPDFLIQAPEGVHLDLPEPNRFYHDLKLAQWDMDDVADTFVVVLLSCFATACIFMVSIVQTELFHRRRELGYLQIFGLRRGRIGRMVLWEYAITVGAALGAALLAFGLLYLLYRLVFGAWLVVELPFVALVLTVLTAAYLLTAAVSAGRALRKPILALIT